MTVMPLAGGSGNFTRNVRSPLSNVDALGLEPDDVLLLAVRHRRLGGLGAEAIDDRLHAGDLLGLQHRLLGQPLFVARSRGSVLAVRALVLDQLADCVLGRTIEVQHTGDRLVEQVEVVADHQQRTAVGAQELQQPHLGVDVEVVGRLVEQQARRSRRTGCGPARHVGARHR